MFTQLIVTENDNGESLNLNGEWSVDSVDYDEEGNSITTYSFPKLSRDDKREIERSLDAADGVLSYRWE